MTAPRVHACGQPMERSTLSSHSRTPRHRGQPVWSCFACSAWEPHEGWRGQFPNEWDGQRWTDSEGADQ